MSEPITSIDVRPAGVRPHTRGGWLDSRHSFSFGRHYDPANTHHGLLLVSNDDRVKAGTGFTTHPHQDMEIVTWVLEGELEHKDTLGTSGVLYPGLAQRMTAGRGIWHSEMNPSRHADVHFIQMWVLPDSSGVDPSYEQLDINAELDRGGLVPVASGKGHHSAIAIRQQGAALWAGRLRPGDTVTLPDAAHVHLFVAAGAASLEGAGALAEGDAVRLTAAGPLRITADPAQGAEILVWETP
jgi:redox-sensitive bicupin YhaK (pirin superfamily)